MKRTRDDWRRDVLRDPKLADSTRVMLLHIADRYMRGDRKFSVPRKKLANDLNRAERRITERFTDAVNKGYLVKVSAGFKGHTAEYQGTWPNRYSGTDRSPLQSGTDSSPLSPVQSGTPAGPTTSKRHLSIARVCDVGSDADMSRRYAA